MITEYIRSDSVEEAYGLLTSVGSRARLMGGGTDLSLHPPADVDTLIDLSGASLGGITRDDNAIAIGATVTLTEMLEYEPLATVWSGVVHTMLRRVASPLHRNAASIGGHLARGRLSDVVPVMLAIDASVRFYDGAPQQMPLGEFYATRRNRRPLVVTGVEIPVDGGRAAFRKFARTTYDLAILNVACGVRFDGSVVSSARIVVGERPSLAVELGDASGTLIGRPFDEDSIGQAARVARDTVDVRSDPRGSADYRRHLTEVLVRRCLSEIAP
jgi:carbon-monoxide dehydrogenase medium subunit